VVLVRECFKRVSTKKGRGREQKGGEVERVEKEDKE